MSDKVCAFPGCGRPFWAKTYCASHWRQQHNGRPLTEIGWTQRKKVCSFPGCGREHASNGSCSSHARQQAKGQPLTDFNAPREIKLCSVPECGRKSQAKGLCQSHRKRQLDGKPLGPIRRRLPKKLVDTCTFPGCEGVHKSKGLCSGHHAQRKKGAELTPLKSQRTSPRDAPAGEKFCLECDQYLPLAQFRLNYGQPVTYCSTCTGLRQLAKARNISLDEARTLRSVDQCEICEGSDPRFLNFAVDHDHWTGEVRGVLCRSHNSLLGFARDLPHVMESGAHYIERYDGLLRFYPPHLPRRKEQVERRGTLPEGFKWCGECEQVLPRSEFSTNGWCFPCSRIRTAARTHQTTVEHIKELRSRTYCEICLTTDPGSRFGVFHIDHNHTTGVIRGVLCNNCNLMIGHAQDDPRILRAAAGFIRRYGLDYITRLGAQRRAA